LDREGGLHVSYLSARTRRVHDKCSAIQFCALFLQAAEICVSTRTTGGLIQHRFRHLFLLLIEHHKCMLSEGEQVSEWEEEIKKERQRTRESASVR